MCACIAVRVAQIRYAGGTVFTTRRWPSDAVACKTGFGSVAEQTVITDDRIVHATHCRIAAVRRAGVAVVVDQRRARLANPGSRVVPLPPRPTGYRRRQGRRRWIVDVVERLPITRQVKLLQHDRLTQGCGLGCVLLEVTSGVGLRRRIPLRFSAKSSSDGFALERQNSAHAATVARLGRRIQAWCHLLLAGGTKAENICSTGRHVVTQ